MIEALDNKIKSATKWSTLTEVTAKLISPITNMVLARILTPEIFGIIATITMITSFADLFTDAGFQKYLIQHEFENESELFKHLNVAFWSNLALSIFLWGIIAIFNNQIANQVGCPGLGHVMMIASTILILTSFSSIQMAYYRRYFNYKILFFLRIVGVCIPLIITIPLVFLGFGYWSLIIASICMELLNAIILTVKSKWKPFLFYKFSILKSMLSFSLWALLETLGKWLKDNSAIFIVGRTLSVYYLGLYKTSIMTVVGIMGLLYSPLVPVAYSALSRVQDNEIKFKEIFLNFQLLLSLVMLPIGLGTLLYNETVTTILLGRQWSEAAGFIGLFCCTNAFVHIFSDMSMEAFRAKGNPKLGVFSIYIYVFTFIPLLSYSVKFGFVVLYHATAYSSIIYILICTILMHKFLKISTFDLIKKIYPIILGTAIMGGTSCLLKMINNNLIWNVCSICICAIVYMGTIICFPQIREIMKPYVRGLIKRK